MHNNLPLVSVIMPVYNGEKYLNRAIDSVLNQSYKNIELLLINDCSTDNSLTICKKYREKDNRVIIYNNQTNSGSGFGKNYGIEHANGEFLMFIDDDDYIDLKIMDQCMHLLLINSSDIVTFGYSDDKLHRGNDHYTLVQPLVISGKDAVHLLFNRKNVDSNPWGKIYKKKVFEDIRFPLNTYYDDINVVYKTFINAESVCISGICGYAHMDNGESISGRPFRKKDWDFIKQSEILVNEVNRYLPEYSQSVLSMMDEAVIWILMKYLQKGGDISKEQKTFLYKYFNNNFNRYIANCNSKKEKLAMYTIKWKVYPIIHKIVSASKH